MELTPQSAKVRQLLATDPMFARLYAQVQVPEPVYAAYWSEVEAFLDQFLELEHRGPFTKVSRWVSRLFGRRFLVGQLNAGARFESDAIATATMAMDRGRGLPPLKVPPHVLTLGRAPGQTATVYQATLERAAVDVCMAILGTLPERNPPPGPLLGRFMRDVRRGVCGHYLTTATWPGLYRQTRAEMSQHAGLPVSMEDWCLLRAYPEALEKMLFAALAGDISPAQLREVLDGVETLLVEEFHQAGLSERMAERFSASLPLHIPIALDVLAEMGLRPKGEVAKVLARWTSTTS